MTRSARLTATLAATALAAACASTAPVPAPRAAALPPPASPDEALPGIDLGDLAAPQRELVAAYAQSTFTYCGAPRTVSAALRQHAACRHAPRMASLAVRLAGAGLTREQLARAMTDYYASFDAPKRARLDLDGFGPPLGDAAAPVTMVVFSDFTCPYCQRERAVLEKFVADHPGRVRLFFKPFAIPTHANSLEAASAAEWARDQGAFWKVHDALFDSPYAVDPDSLAETATGLGLDGAALKAALDAGTYAAKVRGSMAEAKAAGITGTPTIFLNGRMLRAPDLSEASLEFNLEDEEEWVRGGGWARD